MTRDEAIECLRDKKHCKDCKYYQVVIDNTTDLTCWDEAHKMAIEALEQYEDAFEHGYTDAESNYRAILERKRGEWHEYDKPYHLHCCRNCGEDALFTKDGQEVLSNYCAFCGADMRERREE